MDYIIHWFYEPLVIGILATIGGAGVIWMCKWLICKKYSSPKIMIDLEDTVGFKPNRTILNLSVWNEALQGIGKFIGCEREELCYWIEAEFRVNDNLVLLGGGYSATSWDSKPNHITCKANSVPYTVELVSKIQSENGFHIKRPTPETLMVAEDVIVYILIKTGKDKIIKKGTWVIFNTGEENDFVDIERLE